MWADAETDSDFLNYSEVAELVAELISDPHLRPLSLGIFGGWGTGKSTTLRLVEAELAKTKDKYLVVKFDAWLYQDFDDARAALRGRNKICFPRHAKVERSTNLSLSSG